MRMPSVRFLKRKDVPVASRTEIERMVIAIAIASAVTLIKAITLTFIEAVTISILSWNKMRIKTRNESRWIIPTMPTLMLMSMLMSTLRRIRGTITNLLLELPRWTISYRNSNNHQGPITTITTTIIITTTDHHLIKWEASFR
jgi:hypothetical protein